jgi:hypothetical protein
MSLFYPEGLVFGRQLLQALSEFFLVGLGVRLNRDEDDRLETASPRILSSMSVA